MGKLSSIILMAFTFVLTSMVFSTIVKSQSLNCAKFRSGTFTMKFKGGSEIIERYGRYQRETVVGTKIPLSFIITWTDDCHYTLKPMPSAYKYLNGASEDDVMSVTIIKTTKNSYTQISTLRKIRVTDEMIKIK